jgi:hypothetical protein
MAEAEMLEGSAVINDLGRFACLLVTVLVTQACAKAASVDLKAESDRLSRVVCAQKTVADAQRALDTLKVEYHLSDSPMQLNAIRRYNEDQLVSSAIAITIGFDVDRKVTGCKVEILHTGP